MMAVLIVSGVLVASLGTFGAIGRSRQAEVERAQAFGLAEQMMAEVLQGRFEEAPGSTVNGPDVGEGARSQYDDVDDYNEYEAAPQARDGAPLAGYAGWAVRAWVRNVTPGDPAGPTAAATPAVLKRIQVRVTTPAGVRHDLYGLRARAGAYEAAAAGTYLAGAAVAVRVGERGRQVQGGAHPLNVTPSE